MRLDGLTYECIRPSVQSFYFCDLTTQSHASEWEKFPQKSLYSENAVVDILKVYYLILNRLGTIWWKQTEILACILKHPVVMRHIPLNFKSKKVHEDNLFDRQDIYIYIYIYIYILRGIQRLKNYLKDYNNYVKSPKVG